MERQDLYSVDSLRRFMEQALAAAGVPPADAAVVADNLLYSELQGIKSHGLTRFSIYYKRVREGFVNPRPELKITRRLPAVLAVDGDNGLGTVVAYRALQQAMAVADTYGVCTVGIRHSNHFGAAGFYCNAAAEKGYITMALTNAPPAQPPWGGKEAFLGTNPIAFGLPRRSRPHIIVDLATTLVARGKIIAAAKEGRTIPADWALDKDGRPTTDAKAALQGVLLPMAGPKGYALGLVVDYLSGVLTGAGYGPQITNQYSGIHRDANVGHFFQVTKPEAFGSLEDYFARAEEYCQELKAVATMPDVAAIKLPGEREWESEQRQVRDGIKLESVLAEEFATIAADTGVELK